MSDHSRRPRLHGLLPIFAAAALGALGCSDPLTLPPANQATVELTVTLYALTGTPVGTPSAYTLGTASSAPSAVRTDRTIDFDFAVDLVPGTGTDTNLVILPRGAVGFALDGGAQRASIPYDSITIAPTSGYRSDSALAVGPGDVVLLASRLQQCNFGINRPRYAKLRVESVDRAQRSAVLLMRIDPNCGYRGLAAGVPTS